MKLKVDPRQALWRHVRPAWLGLRHCLRVRRVHRQPLPWHHQVRFLAVQQVPSIGEICTIGRLIGLKHTSCFRGEVLFLLAIHVPVTSWVEFRILSDRDVSTVRNRNRRVTNGRGEGHRGNFALAIAAR